MQIGVESGHFRVSGQPLLLGAGDEEEVYVRGAHDDIPRPDLPELYEHPVYPGDEPRPPEHHVNRVLNESGRDARGVAPRKYVQDVLCC